MMSDREKVIKEKLDEMVELTRGLSYAGFMTAVENANDILALLKEQEAIEPKVIGTNGFGHPIHACGKCGHLITESMNYCHECGKRIEWEGR